MHDLLGEWTPVPHFISHQQVVVPIGPVDSHPQGQVVGVWELQREPARHREFAVLVARK